MKTPSGLGVNAVCTVCLRVIRAAMTALWRAQSILGRRAQVYALRASLPSTDGVVRVQNQSGQEALLTTGTARAA